MGMAFAVLGAVAWWRTHIAIAQVLLGIGCAWGLAGIVIPSRLGRVYRAWMGAALTISKVTTPIVLGAVYFLVITPIGVIMRRLGRNPLRRRLREGSYWIPRSEEAAHRGSMRNQF